MQTRTNTLLLFSKFPEVGKVKTRLTILKDGIFPPEDGKELYEAMLLDVVDVILDAFNHLRTNQTTNLTDFKNIGESQNISDEDVCEKSDKPYQDVYELVISCAPKDNVSKMKELIEREFGANSNITFISDSGQTFDDHYNDAFSQCFNSGSDCILSMGADMPALRLFDIYAGFDALHQLWDENRPGIVLAPDQEMGVSIIGWNKGTSFDHSGVFYNKTGLTVLPAYIEKAKVDSLEVIYLPPVPDVDTITDLFHNATLVQSLVYCSQFGHEHAPNRTMRMLEALGLGEIRVSPNNLMDPRDEIDCE